MSTDEQKIKFQERLGRLSQQQKAQESHPFSESLERVRALDSRQSAQSESHPSLGSGAVNCLIAFLIGAGSILIGRIVVFNYIGTGVALDDLFGMLMLFGGDIGISIVLSIVLMSALGLEAPLYVFFDFAGFVLVLFGEGALAIAMPELWAAMFSPEYVQQIIQDQSSMGAGFDALNYGLFRE